MALVQVVPGGTDAELIARAKTNRIPPPMDIPPGGLFPLKSAGFEVDRYRLMLGWPVPVPDYDIHARTLISAEGAILQNRDAALALVTGAQFRWTADPSYWDETTLSWSPCAGGCSPWVAGSTTNKPTLYTDYAYRIGDERFADMCALNFDSNTDDYLTNNLDTFMGGVTGYSVVMVLSPNSIYGNDPNVLEKAIWGPADTDDHWALVSVRGQQIWMTTEVSKPQQGPPIGSFQANTAPSYLAMVIGRPQTTIYVASGPSKIVSKTMASGSDSVPLRTNFWLGNAPMGTAGTMDMALLDLGIYANPLSRHDVAAEFALLSGAYGGDK